MSFIREGEANEMIGLRIPDKVLRDWNCMTEFSLNWKCLIR